MSGGVFIEIVVDAEAQPFDAVKYTLDGCLGEASGQMRCVLLADWSAVEDRRPEPAADDHSALRLLYGEYGADARVTLAADVPATASSAAFRLYLPAGWRPGPAVTVAASAAQQQAHGLRWFLLPDGQAARLESTEAFERAMGVRRPDEDLDDVVDRIAGSRWFEGVEAGFEHPTLTPRQGKPGPAERRAGRADATPPESSGSTDPDRSRGAREALRGVLRRARP